MCLPGHSCRQPKWNKNKMEACKSNIENHQPDSADESQVATYNLARAPSTASNRQRPKGGQHGEALHGISLSATATEPLVTLALDWASTSRPPHGVSNDSSRCAMQVEASWAHGLPVEFVSPGHGDFALHDDAVQGLSFTFLSPIDRGLFGPRSGQKQGADAPR